MCVGGLFPPSFSTRVPRCWLPLPRSPPLRGGQASSRSPSATPALPRVGGSRRVPAGRPPAAGRGAAAPPAGGRRERGGGGARRGFPPLGVGGGCLRKKTPPGVANAADPGLWKQQAASFGAGMGSGSGREVPVALRGVWLPQRGAVEIPPSLSTSQGAPQRERGDLWPEATVGIKVSQRIK